MKSLPRPIRPRGVVVCVRSCRPGECITTPGPLGEYDEARGCRSQGNTGFFFSIPVTLGLSAPAAQGRRRAATRAGQSSQRNDNEPTGSKRRSAPADGTALAGPWPDRSTSSPRRGKEGAFGLTPQKAARRPTTRSKRVGRITTSCNTPHLHLNGWAPTRGPQGRTLEVELASPPRRVRGAAAPQHRKTRLRGPRRQEGGREGGESDFGSASEEAGDGGAGSPGTGRTECSFLCLFLLLLFPGGLGRRRPGSPCRISNACLGRDKVMYIRKAHRRCHDPIESHAVE